VTCAPRRKTTAIRILKLSSLALEATLAGHKPWELSLRVATSPAVRPGDVVLLCPTQQAPRTWPVRCRARVARTEHLALAGCVPARLMRGLAPDLQRFCHTLWTKWQSQRHPPSHVHVTWLTDITALESHLDLAIPLYAPCLPHPRICSQLPRLRASPLVQRTLCTVLGLPELTV
jgi:hypothetical protein